MRLPLFSKVIYLILPGISPPRPKPLSQVSSSLSLSSENLWSLLLSTLSSLVDDQVNDVGVVVIVVVVVVVVVLAIRVVVVIAREVVVIVVVFPMRLCHVSSG